MTCSQVPDYPAQLITFFNRNKPHFDCLEDSTCVLIPEETTCAEKFASSITISFIMRQVRAMTDETIFIQFEDAFGIYITLGSFNLEKRANRKRSTHLATATNLVTATSYTHESWIYCNEGWGRVNERCVRCPAGYRSSLETRLPCVICPVGTYNERPGHNSCTSCPAETSTPSTGTTSADHCSEFCTVPAINNGNPFPFVNFNVSLDSNITITCNPNPDDADDRTFYSLEFGQRDVMMCAAELPGCFRTCKLEPLDENLVYLEGAKVNDIIKFKEKIRIKCADGSSVFAVCGEEGEFQVDGCGGYSGGETPYLQSVLTGVGVFGLFVCLSIIFTAICIKIRTKVSEKVIIRQTKSVALTTNIYEVQTKVVLSRSFDSRSFLRHVQVFAVKNIL